MSDEGDGEGVGAKELHERVLEGLRPTDEERESLREAYERVKERARDALDERGVEADVTLVGSTARDTWLSGDRDIDVFLLLPRKLDREDFEEVGLNVGHDVFPDGTVEYAEHPYLKGKEDGYEVDIVPCYDLDEPTDVRSAVDRTPFHNEYVLRRKDEVEGFGDEVRLLKAFARAHGVYGSDLRTRGLSGYLCELLILHYGDFGDVVNAVADWTPLVRVEFVEPADAKDFEGPLIVVDPVDPSRNVAAVVSQDSFARLVDASREYVADPNSSSFIADELEPMGNDEFKQKLAERGTRLVALVFDAPDVVDDQLYPQLRKTRKSLVDELERQGFDVLRSDASADERAVVLVEANVGEQSKVEKHFGPPVHVGEHAESFKRKYTEGEAEPVAGPYIEGGRYVVEREREHTTVESFAESDDLFGISTGKHVEESLKDGYEVLVDRECGPLLDEFGTEFAEYFDP